MFQKIVIADRGETALRVARTCQRLGIATVAIHSGVDADAPHVTACGEAIALPVESGAAGYLDAAAIVAGARACGAQAIHPGGSVLARSPLLAKLAHEAGLAFVGASEEAITRVLDVCSGRALAEQAGAHVLPVRAVVTGEHGAALEAASDLGYPLALRGPDDALLGIADATDELLELLALAARAGVTSARLEPAVDRPRLLSVHVIADRAGNCVPLTDVEHSLGSAERALLVETPSPVLTGLPSGRRKRETLHATAVDVAREAGIVGLAAIEVLLDHHARIHFVRLLPGLPASHALTEVCGGVDLVEAELRVAAGEPLPDAVRFIQPSGHAVEARLHAEASTGAEPPVISALQWPVMPKGALRVETDLEVGKPARAHEGRPLARVVAHGPTRHQALLTLDRTLAESLLEPLVTNAAVLRQILGDESFRAGQYDAGFLERMPPAATSLIPAV